MFSQQTISPLQYCVLYVVVGFVLFYCTDLVTRKGPNIIWLLKKSLSVKNILKSISSVHSFPNPLSLICFSIYAIHFLYYSKSLQLGTLLKRQPHQAQYWQLPNTQINIAHQWPILINRHLPVWITNRTI